MRELSEVVSERGEVLSEFSESVSESGELMRFSVR